MKKQNSVKASSKVEQRTFLPNLRFNPIYPSKNTPAAQCLAIMLNVEDITGPDFEHITGCNQLSVVIFILEGLGWPVQSAECDNCSHTHYYLTQQTINAALGGFAK